MGAGHVVLIESAPALDPGLAFCHECRRSVPQRKDGYLAAHRDRGGRRCAHSGKQSPDWLRALVDAETAGQLHTRWAIEEVALHLGVRRHSANQILREEGVEPVAKAGRQYFYDALDIHEVGVRRDHGGRWRRYPLSDVVVQRLRELYSQARLVNGSTPLDSPARDASLELTRQLVELHQAGTSFDLLDQAIGARPGTSRRRMTRHQAHGTLPPSVAPYRGVQIARWGGGRKPRDRVGETVGYLTVLGATGETNDAGYARWRCRCVCGTEIVATTRQLSPQVGIKSCGCRTGKGRKPQVQRLRVPAVL